MSAATEAPARPEEPKDPDTIAPFAEPDRLVDRTLHLLEEVLSVVRRIGGEEWYTVGNVDERGGDPPTLTRLGMSTVDYAIDVATRAHEELWYMESKVAHPRGDVTDALYDAGRTLATVTGALEGIVYGQPDIPLYHIAWGCNDVLDRAIRRIRARMEPDSIEPPEWNRIRVKEVLRHLRAAERAAGGMDCHNAIEAVEVDLERLLTKTSEEEEADHG